MKEIPVDVRRCILGADYYISTKGRSGSRFVGINLMTSEDSLEVVAEVEGEEELKYCEISIEDLLRHANEAEKAGFAGSNN